MKPPVTIDDVKAHKYPEDRARAARLYLERLEQKRVEAIAIRNEAVRAMSGGPTEIAAATGLSRDNVKLIRRTR